MKLLSLRFCRYSCLFICIILSVITFSSCTLPNYYAKNKNPQLCLLRYSQCRLPFWMHEMVRSCVSFSRNVVGRNEPIISLFSMYAQKDNSPFKHNASSTPEEDKWNEALDDLRWKRLARQIFRNKTKRFSLCLYEHNIKSKEMYMRIGDVWYMWSRSPLWGYYKYIRLQLFDVWRAAKQSIRELEPPFMTWTKKTQIIVTAVGGISFLICLYNAILMCQK